MCPIVIIMYKIEIQNLLLRSLTSSYDFKAI
nr:MAG TPA: hypothetical protein [Caudoviricetes sp.]